MITKSGHLYVIHGGVTVRYDGETLELHHNDDSIITGERSFVDGVLAAACRQQIPVEARDLAKR